MLVTNERKRDIYEKILVTFKRNIERNVEMLVTYKRKRERYVDKLVTWIERYKAISYMESYFKMATGAIKPHHDNIKIPK